MSTSYHKSSYSTPDGPNVANAYDSLVKFLRAQRDDAGISKRVYSTTRLLDVAGGIPSVGMAGVLTRLVQDGFLEQFLRVESELGSGIQDFESFDLVPDEVYDWKDTKENLRVTPSNLRVFYRLHRDT
jgi:hypothetical protein